MRGYQIDCELCGGHGLTVGFGGSLIRCSWCFGIEAAKADNEMVTKFHYDDVADRFDEAEYDQWRAGVDAEMRHDQLYAREADRQHQALTERQINYQIQAANRLVAV